MTTVGRPEQPATNLPSKLAGVLPAQPELPGAAPIARDDLQLRPHPPAVPEPPLSEPGLFGPIKKRLADAVWKWHPANKTWAGVPPGVLELQERLGRSANGLYNGARRSALGRLMIKLVGGSAFSSRLIDKLLWLRPTPQPPAPPQGPLPPPLPRMETSLSWLGTQGNRIVDESGKPVRLRGVNISGLENAESPRHERPETYDAIEAMGANLVRIPINQDHAMRDPAYLKRLDTVVALASERGLYVMFDLHWHGGHQQALPNDESLALWRRLANRYANQPGVLYDLHNEPGFVSWKQYAPWAEAMIAAVREVHPKSLVVVEGTQMGRYLGDVAKRPLRAPNVVYQTHAYGPGLHLVSTGEGAWERDFGKVSAKVPVIVGEWGGRTDELPYMQDLVAYMDRLGLSWAAWNYGASATPGMLTHDDGTELTPFGRLVAQSLER